MDAKSFRRLCATLGSLTGPQLKELRAALRSLDARMQAIGAIEKRREGVVACPHCGHDRNTRWGSTRTGVQRLRCRSFRRTLSSSTGTALAASIRRPLSSGDRRHVCDHPRSCRRLGRALALNKMTIWRWRQKIIRALGGSGASNLGGVVEADEKFFRDPARARVSGSGISAIRSIIRSRTGCAGWITNARERNCRPGSQSIRSRSSRWRSRRRQARGRIARPQRAAADGGARKMLARRRGPLQRP